MKGMLRCLLLVSFLFVGQAQAFYGGNFRAQAHISFSQFQATATVLNNSWRAVVCSGYAYGRTWSGITYHGYMNSQIIYPGRYAHVQVYTNYYDGFVNAWSDIWCRYL